MENQIISSKDLTELQRRKFCLLKKDFHLTMKTMPLFKKYAPKYARKVEIAKNECPKTTNPRLKRVNSFSFSLLHSWRSSKRDRLKKGQIFKIIKHHKKFIQSFHGMHLSSQLIKELPQLRSHDFNFYGRPPGENYRIMTFCRKLERISFDLKYGCSTSEVQLFPETLERNKSQILRALRTMRSMKKLSLEFQDESFVSFTTFLQVFGSCPLFLSSLEIFAIDQYSCREKDFPGGNLYCWCQQSLPVDVQNDVNVKMAVRFITHLKISDNIAFENFFSDHEVLANLKSLAMKIKPGETCNEAIIRKLSMFKLLPKLKDFDLDFYSRSKQMEKIFLESFSLPKEIGCVMLRLAGLKWKASVFELTKENRRIIEERFEKHPRFQRFYNKWKSLSNLQTLKLTINNRYIGRKCPTLNLKFAMGILRQVRNLKSLEYQNNVYVPNEEEVARKMLPMDLGVFWESLENSKKTLENLEINVSEMNFFAKKDLQKDFFDGWKKLKKIEISGQIYWARNFGDFLNIIAQKNKSGGKMKINVHNLYFKDEKYLTDFFENLEKIPKDLEVELSLDISELNCSKWLESFCRFVARLKVEGTLKFKIKEAKIQSTKEVERIQQSVLKNPVFEELVFQGQMSKSFCIIRKSELVSGVDPWLIDKGHIKTLN